MPEQTLEIQRQEPRELSPLQIIADAVRDPNVDPAKMRGLLDMRMEIVKYDAEVEFKAAMARVQSRVPRINKLGKIVVPAKDGKTGHQTPYALYEDIDDAIRPLIQEEGFSESFTAETTTLGTVWRCIVSHRAGHSETYSCPALPPDQTGSKNQVQAVFSANSYAKRYLRTNIWNIITIGVDDDGRGAGYLDKEQIRIVCDLLNEAAIYPEDSRMKKFLEFAEADAVNHIQKHRFERCVNRLKATVREKGKNG